MTPSKRPDVNWDPILPTQVFDSAHSALSKTGEYRLLVAVLQNAIHCFQTNMHATDVRDQRLFVETQQWIMGDGVHDDCGAVHQDLGFSFEYVCEMLDIVPDRLRDSLRRDARRVRIINPSGPARW